MQNRKTPTLSDQNPALDVSVTDGFVSAMPMSAAGRRGQETLRHLRQAEEVVTLVAPSRVGRATTGVFNVVDSCGFTHMTISNRVLVRLMIARATDVFPIPCRDHSFPRYINGSGVADAFDLDATRPSRHETFLNGKAQSIA
jgi:hypothetical protein